MQSRNEKEILLDKFFEQMEDDFKQEYYSGNLFNIFNELSISTDEVKHSSFLSGLLNPKGFHGCSNIFLTAFLKEIGLNDCEWLKEYNNLTFTCEYFIGNRNHKDKSIDKQDKNYGRIDILIEYEKGNIKKGIIIENKIYAKDQDAQIKRYFNFASERYANGKNKGIINEDFYIYYLTLEKNKKPSEKSIKDIKKEDIKSISYEIEILNFLKKSINRDKNDFLLQPLNPQILNVLKQYILVIKQLTNKTNYFINKIYQLEEYRNKINERDLDYYRSNLRKTFFEKLRTKLEEKISKEDINFVYSINNDGNKTSKSLKQERHKKNFGIEIQTNSEKLNIEIQNWSKLIYGVFNQQQKFNQSEELLNNGFKENRYWTFKEFEIKNSENIPFPFYNDFLNFVFKRNLEIIIEELNKRILSLYKILN